MERLINDRYSFVRGFNYFPSNVTFLRDVTEMFDENLWMKELGYARIMGANTIRVWFDIDSHMRNQERFLEVFSKILTIIRSYDMKLMPVLYNDWVDKEHPIGAIYPQDIYSGSRKRHYDYLKSVVGTFSQEETIIMWDLCNEPYSSEYEWGEELLNKQTDFWLDLANYIHQLKPKQPLTMGTHSFVSRTPECIYKELDVLSCHVYQGWENDTFEETLEPHVKHANEIGKALVCTETFQGSLNDVRRALCIERCKKAFKAANVGYIAFQLMEGKMISARRDWTDDNCAPGDRGYFPFVLLDGTVRENHTLL